MTTSLTALAALLAFVSPIGAGYVKDAPVVLAQVEPDLTQPPRAEAAPEVTPRVTLSDEGAGDLSEPMAETPVIEVPAGPADPYAVTGPARQDILDGVAAALSQVKTASGTFTQIAPDFSISTGSYALRRPGRMRFEYDDPTPLLIVSDGTTVAIEDRDLETVDRVPLVSTPLGMVLDDRIDFETDAEVTRVEQVDDIISVSMRDRTGEADGELTLYLGADDYALLSWRTEDAGGGVTTVQLADTVTNERLDPRLFRLDDPDEDDDRRR